MDLLAKRDEVFNHLAITSEQTRELEEASKNQSLCKLWFQYKAWYCDFVVWSPDELVIMRIEPAGDFIATASLNMEFYLSLLVSGTLKHQYTDTSWLQPMDRTLQQTVLLTHQREDLLLRMDMKLGATAEERLKGR